MYNSSFESSNSTNEFETSHDQRINDINESEYKVKKVNINLDKKEVKRRESEVQVDESGIYRFKYLGEDQGLLIGTDIILSSNNYANAFVNTYLVCPDTLIVPRTLTDQNGVTKDVESIGAYAFARCSYESGGFGKTKEIIVTRQVKVIKKFAFASMYDLRSFSIEAGSVLETIEQYAIHYIGYYYGANYTSKRTTLVLPSTLSSIESNGLYYCYLFHTIIYCGSHPLTAACSGLNMITPNIVVKVTSRYPADQKIFGANPDRDSHTEVWAECGIMTKCQFQKNRSCSTKNNIISPLLLYLILLSKSDSEDGKIQSLFGIEAQVIFKKHNKSLRRAK